VSGRRTPVSAVAMFKGGPLDGMALELPAGSFGDLLWADASLGGRYRRWCLAPYGFTLAEPVPVIEGERAVAVLGWPNDTSPAQHYYEWEPQA